MPGHDVSILEAEPSVAQTFSGGSSLSSRDTLTACSGRRGHRHPAVKGPVTASLSDLRRPPDPALGADER